MGTRLLFVFFLPLVPCSNLWAATVQLQPIGDITTWPGTLFRWKDVADFTFADDYQEDFTYSQPAVTVTYCDTSNHFTGTLSAAGLKPNFAYQIKLVGKPQEVWGEDGDDWANEQIGYAGRWWRKQPDPGNSNAHDFDYGAARVSIYAEWQSDRNPPGEIVFPPGNYSCQFILTEESFHQSGLGGGWVSMMGYDDLHFILVLHKERDMDLNGDVNGAGLALLISEFGCT